MTDVVVTTGAVRRAELQSNRYHQQTPTPNFLQAGWPSCRPTNSVKSLLSMHLCSTEQTEALGDCRPL